MSDILIASTMLKARGGALDLKAAEIIEDLAAQLVGKKVGEKLDAQWQQRDLAAARAELRDALEMDCEPHAAAEDGEVHTLASTVRTVLSQMRTEHRGALLELDEINEKLRSALKPFLCDPCFLTPLLAADAAAEEIKRLRAELAEAAFDAAYAPDAQPSGAEHVSSVEGALDSFTAKIRSIDSNATCMVDIRPDGDYGFSYALKDKRHGQVIWYGGDIKNGNLSWERMGEMAGNTALAQIRGDKEIAWNKAREQLGLRPLAEEASASRREWFEDIQAKSFWKAIEENS